MSLFQCQRCGCVENTALSRQGCNGYAERFFDWTGRELSKGLKLCSACAPDKMVDGAASKLGTWHGEFKRVYLPMGEFETNEVGNLRHKVTGDCDYRKYALDKGPYELENPVVLTGAMNMNPKLETLFAISTVASAALSLPSKAPRKAYTVKSDRSAATSVEAFEKAEEKRQRRAAKRLKDAGLEAPV